jgi:signal transduction histidine kinase
MVWNRARVIDSLNRSALGRAAQRKQPGMRILNMPKETEQQDMAEMPDEFQVQADFNKYRTGLRRLKATCVRPTRMVTVSMRSERRRENLSGVDWLYASIVHDLRNPLGAICAASEMLLEADTGPTQVKRLATNIYRAAGRMRELLADLSSVARGDRPTAEICDIGEVIAAAFDAASATMNNDNVQILLKVSDGVELPLIRSHMERVFFNLIANALEAMPAGGQIHVVCRKANSYVLIELEDTGPGIPRGIRDRLFEPFVTAGKQEGLGLGLALSRQTVLNHGGDIWTEPATGARFVIRLPLTQAKPSIDKLKSALRTR